MDFDGAYYSVESDEDAYNRQKQLDLDKDDDEDDLVMRVCHAQIFMSIRTKVLHPWARNIRGSYVVLLWIFVHSEKNF